MALTTVQQVQAAYLAIVRAPLNDASAAAIASAIDGGTTTYAAYQAGLIAQVNTTTTAAIALSTFIEGVVPTSARVDSLTAFAKTQFDYYTNTLKSANAQLGAYEALGKAFAADASTSASFAARYGALSATDFVNAVYATVNNSAGAGVPTPGALANLVGQVAYFTDIYTKAGIPAADAALQAKGAVFGQIIGYAFTNADTVLNNPSTFDETFEGFLNTAADEARAETTPSTIYNAATLGKSITVVGDVSPTSAVLALQSTQFGDKMSGTLGVGTFTDATKIDGGAGVDTLTFATTALNSAYAPAADVVKNVEKVAVSTFGAAATVDVTNIKGLTDFSLAAGSATALAVTGLESSTNVHVAATLATADLTIGYASAAAAAKVSIDANYAGQITFSDAAVKSVTADVTVASSGVSFADNDLTSVTVTSKGDVTFDTIGTGLKTLDASGVGTFVKGGITDVLANAATVTLSKGADAFSIIASKGHTITLGANADTLTVVQQAVGNVDATSNDTVTKTVLTVTDFSKADADILRLDGTVAVRVALDATQLGQIAGSADLKAAATLAGTFAAAVGADDWSIFNFGTDAYALYDVGNNGFGSGDTLIKLTGFAVADLTATNLFIV